MNGMKLLGAALLTLLWLAPVRAADTGFDVAAAVETNAAELQLVLDFHVPAHAYLYVDQVTLDPSPGILLPPVGIPDPQKKKDAQGGWMRVYLENTRQVYRVDGMAPTGFSVTVGFQGCDAHTCFLPQTRTFHFPAGAAVAARAAMAEKPAADIRQWQSQWCEAGRTVGYQSAEAFLPFLDAGHAAPVAAPAAPLSGTRNWRGWWTVILILLGGAALNLTPCVLPMIPINLAIIGAGARAQSRRRGFLLGLVYGLGMALVYGTLGVVTVLTGAQFGTLNAMPWFNFTLAVVFGVLALAMFDLVQIDFSRFQKAAPDKVQAGRLWAALSMGGVAALLAGACVAPVVLWVLLLAGDLYGRGDFSGIFLPFVLGLGMGLPWPVVGAGLTLLPSPGAWMTRVKYAFGVFIIITALWYGYQGVVLLRPVQKVDLAAELQRAAVAGKPVFLDFWATWCKNCETMDATTFKNEKVVRRMAEFTVIKYQAEHPDDPATRAVLDAFNVKGLPTYIILQPAP